MRSLHTFIDVCRRKISNVKFNVEHKSVGGSLCRLYYLFFYEETTEQHGTWNGLTGLSFPVQNDLKTGKSVKLFLQKVFHQQFWLFEILKPQKSKAQYV